MDRNLAIGICASLLLHSLLGWWCVGLAPRPRALVVEDKKLVRTVNQQIELPKPKPKPKPPEPKPEPKKEEPMAKAEAPAQQPKPAAAAKRPPQPKSAEPQPKNPPPANEPAPLVLSKTYGAGGDSGVAVQTGKDDVLGDPNVDATEENVRRRPPPSDTGKPADAGPAVAAPEAHKVEVVAAKPKESCSKYIEWPEGADMAGRVIEVTLQLEIGEDGGVRKVKILRGAGQPFDAEAIKDIAKCPFAAGTRDGKPVASKIAFVVEFRPR